MLLLSCDDIVSSVDRLLLSFKKNVQYEEERKKTLSDPDSRGLIHDV